MINECLYEMSNVTAYGYACATQLPENLFHIMWKG